MGSRSPTRTVGLAIDRLAHHVGSGPVMQLAAAASRPGVKQKGGSKTRPGPDRERSILLMLDETIITETPALVLLLWPYRPTGPASRSRATMRNDSSTAAINVGSGDVTLLITEQWTKETHQGFLSMIRSHWRGWNIVLFEDRAVTAHGPGQPRMGRRPRDRDPTVTQSHSGAERDGSPVETRQTANRGQPCHTIDRRIHAPCVPIHP